jgi:hypothetical protein
MQGISVCLWTLVTEENSGIYIELMFLDVALNFGQGFFVLAIFGLDEKVIIAPLLKRSVVKFSPLLLRGFGTALEKLRTYHLKTFCCDW